LGYKKSIFVQKYVSYSFYVLTQFISDEASGFNPPLINPSVYNEVAPDYLLLEKMTIPPDLVQTLGNG